MFGHKSKPSRNYVYWSKAPVEGLTLFWEQAHHKHLYQNQLVEIERKRRQESHDALNARFPQVVTLQAQIDQIEAELEEVRGEIKRLNKAARRQVAPKELKARATALGKQLRSLRSDVKEQRRVAWESEDLTEALRVVDLRAQEAHKERQHNSGLYWGNYLDIDQRAAAFRKGAPPTFRRWKDECRPRITVQIQNGMSWEEAWQCGDTRFRLERTAPFPLPEGVPGITPGSKKDSQCVFAMACVRAGSTGKGGRQPLWVKAPVLIGRQPPGGSRIKWVHLQARKVADQWQWILQVTLENEDGFPHTNRKSGEEDDASGGMVAVDIGWRKLDEGLRVASWVGDDGQKGELILPMVRKCATRWKHSDGLRSVRDNMMDQIRPRFTSWLGAHREILPSWLTAWPGIDFIHLWKSTRRLSELIEAWRSQRFSGDEEIFPEMEAWRKQNKHLWTWEANQRQKAVAWRDDVYRKFAVELRRKYRCVVIEDVNWKKLGARKKAEEKNGEARGATNYRQIAAPGRLAQLLCEGFAESLKVKAEHSTNDCHACGFRDETWDHWEELEHVCASCGALWDQDNNSAIILLDRGQAALSERAV